MKKNLYKKYLYIGPKTNVLIIIFAKRRPSPFTMPKSGTWVVREWHDGEWQMPCFPEIIWEKIKYEKPYGIKRKDSLSTEEAIS